MLCDDRTLILRIEGESAREGRVPVALLASKLRAIQHLLFNIGSALRGGGRRGTWKAEVQQACELIFIEARTGSLEIVTKVPEPSTLFPHLEIGTQALARTGETLQAIHRRSPDTIEKFFPDYGQRTRILNSALPLLPEEEAEYEVSVQTEVASVQIGADARTYLVDLMREELGEVPEEEIRTLLGKLYLIEVATGDRQVGLIVRNRRVHCFYSSEYEDIVRDLIPGSLVEVEGRATLSEHGEVERIEEILDARPVDLIPLRWTRVVYGDRIFRLTTPIHVNVDFRDGLWIHECEPLGILAYGESRGKSLNAFRMDFAACWDLVAEEDDANLTVDARELKQKFRELVQEVQELS